MRLQLLIIVLLAFPAEAHSRNRRADRRAQRKTPPIEKQEAKRVFGDRPVARAAKFFNKTGFSIRFRYQFEDSTWRYYTIPPGEGVYIWDFNSTRPLSVSYGERGREKTYNLPTSEIPTHVQAGRPVDPNRVRNDQAAAYSFMANDGSYDLYSGFEPSLYDRSASSLLTAAESANIDLQFLSGTTDPATTDVLFWELEFERFLDQIETVYQSAMNSNDFPSIELLWEADEIAGKVTFRPFVQINCCPSRAQFAGVEFLKKTINRAFPGLVRTISKLEMCYATTAVVIRTKRLDPRYVRNGKPDLAELRIDIENLISKNSNLGIEQTTVNNGAITIYTKYQQSVSGNSVYAWRSRIEVKTRTDADRVLGVEITVSIEAIKRARSSRDWKQISDFAIGELSALPDTIEFDEPAAGPGVRQRHRTAYRGSAVSKAVNICQEIDSRIEGLIVIHDAGGA
jgi:hypothetical protein